MIYETRESDNRDIRVFCMDAGSRIRKSTFQDKNISGKESEEDVSRHKLLSMKS